MWCEKSESVEALKSAKSVLIFLPEFASRLGIVEYRIVHSKVLSVASKSLMSIAFQIEYPFRSFEYF